MKPTFNVSYCTTKPSVGDCPRVTIHNGTGSYIIKFFDGLTNTLIKEVGVYSDQDQSVSVSANRQYYTKWHIYVYDNDGQLVFTDFFDLKNKNVFIKIDAFALGDNIAWIPYVEEFKKKHDCNVICSTFFNELFSEQYKDILFVKPNTEIKNIYAQYYIGANEEGNEIYSNVNSKKVPLQMVATNILGIEFKDMKAKFDIIPNKEYKKPSNERYVCISEKASHPKKEWKEIGGWQKIVDFLNHHNYKVVVISKEPTRLTGVIDKTGNIHLQNRMKDLIHCEFFIGVSSGLSWMSWSLGVKTVIISDVTPSFHEPSDIIRINSTNKDQVDYDFFNVSSFDFVKEKLLNLFNVQI